MADRYWVNDGADGDWENANNWATTSGGTGGAGIPTSSDDVIFDSGDVSNCSLSANASMLSITLNSSYTGQFDAVTYNMTIGSGGLHAIGKSTGAILLGSGTHTCSGDWDCRYSGALTLIDYETCSLTLSGTSKDFYGSGYDSGNNDCNITIAGTYSNINAAGAGITLNSAVFTVSGTLTHNGAGPNSRLILFQAETDTPQLKITSTGTLNGTGLTQFKYIASGSTKGITQNDGSLTCPCVLRFKNPDSAVNYFVAGNYGDLTIETDNGVTNVTVLWGAGNYSIADFVVQNTSSAYITNKLDTNSPNLTVSGDVTFVTSDDVWTKGTGTITLSGTADQSIDFNGESVEDIEVDKSTGTITLAGNVTTESLTLTDATLFDGSTYDVTISGNISNPGAVQVDGSGTWSVTGSADLWWISAIAANWNTATNWAFGPGGDGIGSVPGSGDTAIFDSNGTGACQLDTAKNVLDGVTWNVTNSHPFTDGTGFSGDHKMTAITISANQTMTLNISGKGFTPNRDGGQTAITITLNSGSQLTTTDSSRFNFRNGKADLYGTGAFDIEVCSQNIYRGLFFYGDLTFTKYVNFHCENDTDTTFAHTGTITFQSDVNWAGPNAANTDIIFTNNGSVVYQGDVNMNGIGSYTKGTGTITLAPPSATTSQIDFNGETIEDIDIDGAGTVELTGGFTTDSITVTQGTFDVNLQSVTCSGNFTVAAGTSVIE